MIFVAKAGENETQRMQGKSAERPLDSGQEDYLGSSSVASGPRPTQQHGSYIKLWHQIAAKARLMNRGLSLVDHNHPSSSLLGKPSTCPQ